MFHESVLTNVCTESYYNQNCWECTGCGYYFLNSDMSGSKYSVSDVLRSPVGHYLVHAEAKEPTCVSKGMVEYWECTRCRLKFGDSEGKNELTSIETEESLAAHTYNADGSCVVCGVKAAAGIRTGNEDAVWYDTMDEALDALTSGARLIVNSDYANSITIDKACILEIKAGVTVSNIEVEDTVNGVVTVINNGTVSGNLTGCAGKVVLDSGSGTYSKVTCSGGSAGSLLMKENDAKFCFYRKADGTWLRPEQADESIIIDVTVAYAPLSALQVTGDGITGGSGSYELTAAKGDSVTLTADALDLNGNKSTAATYCWYYESDPDNLLSTESTLTLENLGAGKRTIICAASVDGYNLTASIALTVSGEKDSQSIVLKLSKSAVGIREKVFPILSVENVKEEAAVTYYQMLGETPDPDTDTEINEDFAFTSTGEYQIYAYTAETDNYAATASDPAAITVTPHANHCYCGGTLGHTHEEAEWQAWDGKSEIKYKSIYLPRGNGLLRWDAAYVYLTGDVTDNITVGSRQILYICLNGYSFTCADASKPAITVSCGDKSFAAKLNLCDCGGTGTLGGCTGSSGGSIHAVSYSEVNLYGGTLTGNTLSGNGGAVFVEDSTFTMYGGAITGNFAANGGGIYGSSSGSNISINGGVISGNQAQYGGGIYTRGNSNVNGGTISGNTAKRGGGIYAGSTYVGSRSCRISGNTATEAGAGIYVDSWRLYLGGVHGKNYSFSPYMVVESEEYELSDEEKETIFKASCQSYSYDQIARDPDSYNLEHAVYTGKVVQVMNGDDGGMTYRINITPTSWGGYEDTIYVKLYDYAADRMTSNVLEDDIVTVWGYNFSTITYKSIMGAKITIPAVVGEYIEIVG